MMGAYLTLSGLCPIDDLLKLMSTCINP
jgi:hypothetical protein